MLKVLVIQLYLTLCDPMDCSLCPWDSPGKNTGMGCHSLSRESSRPRDQNQVSCIAGRFFIIWATREAQDYWSVLPCPLPEDLPDPGIEPGSPALQADSLPTELSRKPVKKKRLLLIIFYLPHLLLRCLLDTPNCPHSNHCSWTSASHLTHSVRHQDLCTKPL